MDFWNKKKVEYLEMKLDIAESKSRDLQKQIEKLEAKLRGDRVCDGYCRNCKHSVAPIDGSLICADGRYMVTQCELDCKCKDFERKE